MRVLIPAALTVVILGVFYFFDTPKSLGAHPWWSQKVVLTGLAGVLIATLTLRLPALPRVAVFAALTVAAYFVARHGGQEFAASYAEDARAGKMWFMGWHATMAALGATLTTLLQVRVR